MFNNKKERVVPFLLAALLSVSPLSSQAQQQCSGDLDGDGRVTVDEPIAAVDNSLHGCPVAGPRFVDNGDGTVTDNLTGLMWERKVEGEECLHCWRDRYTWDFAMSGWISAVNGSSAAPGLGGFNDLRLPSVAESRTIVDCNLGIPCLDPVFGSSATSCYWTNATFSSPDKALTLDLSNGGLINLSKQSIAYTRAARGTMGSPMSTKR